MPVVVDVVVDEVVVVDTALPVDVTVTVSIFVLGVVVKSPDSLLGT